MTLTDELLDEIFGKPSVPRVWDIGFLPHVVYTSGGYQVVDGAKVWKVTTMKQLVNVCCMACHEDGFSSGRQYVKRQFWDILGGDGFVKDLMPTSSPDE